MSTRELFFHLDNYNRVADMFRAESDRAAAIVGASYLDGVLEKLLKLKFVQTPKTDLFSGHGPLATFSSRIEIAYALGLFNEDVYHDISLIRRIRNEFAHNLDYATFDESSIRQRCSEFRFVKWLSSQAPDETHRPREQFLLTLANATMTMTQPFHQEWLNRGLLTPGAEFLRNARYRKPSWSLRSAPPEFFSDLDLGNNAPAYLMSE